MFSPVISLWSEIKGFDPEATQGNNNMAGAFERFSLPGTSSYGFGVNVNLIYKKRRQIYEYNNKNHLKGWLLCRPYPWHWLDVPRM